LNKIDSGIVNRCHLIEMNQIANNNAYLPLGRNILKNMGLKANAIPAKTLASYAQKAKGSVRTFMTDVIIQGVVVRSTKPV